MVRWRVSAAAVAAVVLLLSGLAGGCGPGRSGGFRRGIRKLTPFVIHQHEPNTFEQHESASGKTEGVVTKNDPRFRDLVPNYNRNIIYRDEEGTGADLLMTQRCKEKLNTLAISVMSQWPSLKLRVEEGWEEDGRVLQQPLHYEGRAVDVTTSDRDRSKYGMLARLAVEAGFDWVHYESKKHIHCSVKSESSKATSSGGCFPAASVVRIEGGKEIEISELRPGDKVLARDESSGELVYSEVLTFMDREEDAARRFVRLHLGRRNSSVSVTATAAHLAVLASGAPVFVGSLRPGDRLLGVSGEVEVTQVELIWLRGVYAPLTRHGTVVVDGIVMSCYAAVSSARLAHAALAPLRAWLSLASALHGDARSALRVGVHPYVKALYAIGRLLLPRTMFYN